MPLSKAQLKQQVAAKKARLEKIQDTDTLNKFANPWVHSLGYNPEGIVTRRVEAAKAAMKEEEKEEEEEEVEDCEDRLQREIMLNKQLTDTIEELNARRSWLSRLRPRRSTVHPSTGGKKHRKTKRRRSKHSRKNKRKRRSKRSRKNIN